MNPVGSLIENIAAGDREPEVSEIQGPTARCHEIIACQFSSWYSKFSNLEGRKRKNVTVNSVIIDDIPQSFEAYLLSDGVQLPVGADKLSSCVQSNTDWSSDEEEGQNEDSDSEASEPSARYEFPSLNKAIEEALSTLKGSAMVKLNWSAPKDATWVNGGSLKCETPGDVYLLLKSSDFCLHDVLRQGLKDCEDYTQDTEIPRLQLVLRKWCNLHPSMEFRCFVRQHELVAISQRNHSQHYPHLSYDQGRIQDRLIDFFEDTIRNSFAEGTIPNYVFDVYIDQKNRVWLLDFNIWAQSTDGLLFEWSELMTLDLEDEPYFRIVETANQVRQDPLSSYRAPIDTVDLASMTGGDTKSFEAFMKQCRSPEELDASGDEEEGQKRSLDTVD